MEEGGKTKLPRTIWMPRDMQGMEQNLPQHQKVCARSWQHTEDFWSMNNIDRQTKNLQNVIMWFHYPEYKNVPPDRCKKDGGTSIEIWVKAMPRKSTEEDIQKRWQVDENYRVHITETGNQSTYACHIRKNWNSGLCKVKGWRAQTDAVTLESIRHNLGELSVCGL